MGYQTIQRSFSPLAYLGHDSIRVRYKDEDGDISPDVPFALSETLQTAKQVLVGDRDYKKNLHQGPRGEFPSSSKNEKA